MGGSPSIDKAEPLPATVDVVENVVHCAPPVRLMARSILFPESATKTKFESALMAIPAGFAKAAHGPFPLLSAASPLPASVVTPQKAAALADGSGVADCVRDAREETVPVHVATPTEREACAFVGEGVRDSTRDGEVDAVVDIETEGFTVDDAVRQKLLEIDGVADWLMDPQLLELCVDDDDGDTVTARFVAVHDGVAGADRRNDWEGVGVAVDIDVGSASCASASPRYARPSFAAVATG